MVDPIGANTASFGIYTQYSESASRLRNSMSLMSRGVKMANDEAAQVASSERLRAQIDSLEAARQNIDNASSAVQTSDSWMQNVTNNLSRMQELAVQSNDATKTDADKENLNSEFKELQKEVARVIDDAEFNSKKLLQGDFESEQIQVGAEEGETITVNIDNLETLSVGEGTTLASVADNSQINVDSDEAVSKVSMAIDRISSLRSELGGQLKRLDNTGEAVQAYQNDLNASESEIRDVDMARQSIQLASSQIQTNASNALLAQGNQLSENTINLVA